MGNTNAENNRNYYLRKKAAREAERARLGLSVIKPRRKTGAERNRAYRLRKKAAKEAEKADQGLSVIKPIKKTAAERNRAYRLRKKAAKEAEKAAKEAEKADQVLSVIKPIRKTAAERNRAYRLRKKMFACTQLSDVESTLARNKKGLLAVDIATQSVQTNTNSIGEINPGRSNTMPMNFNNKVVLENVDEITMEKQHEIISWREIVKESTEIYLQSYNICDKILHGQISVPKTIEDRLKSTPAKHDSPVDSQKNTFVLSHDTQDMVNDRDDDDDVIVIDNVPEVIVIPSDDAPNDDLPCVIANVKSETLENELQTSKTKHTVTPQNDFECKTMEIQIPKDTKDIFKCLSDGNSINDDKVLSIEEIKSEPDLKGNSELNVSMESTFGILNTQSMTTNNVNTVNNIKMLRSQTKQTLLTDVSRNSESDVKIEVIKIEEEKLMRVDLSNIQLNEQKREEGRPAEMSNNLEQITPKELEVSEPLKAEKNVETFVEIDIPWDTVPIKEEADPEMDFKLSDIRRIYHVDVVNVGENKIGQSENWHQDSFPFSHFITITPNVALNTDDESNRTQRKKEITAYNPTMGKKPDELEDVTNKLPSMSEPTEVQDPVASTLATLFAQPIMTASKSKAQRQREYRQRLKASRTPAQVAAARKSKNERQRKNRLRQAANLAIPSNSLETTTTSPSRSGEESNNVQTRSQRQHAQQQSTTTADQPDERVNLTNEPLIPEIPVPKEVQEALASTLAALFAERITAPKTRAQIQREYRQRITASRTPAQAAAARKSKNERQRKYRLRQAAKEAMEIQEAVASTSATLFAEPTTAAPKTEHKYNVSTDSELLHPKLLHRQHLQEKHVM
ncbi:uncharacterized protein LOC125061088 isoform X39 [Pieris napi]|uniref:uncharacterized protein LOC125061088 isoform X39 n=1 Tax=Pieris napi TaxID=78633 RepID=UPI001FB92398|nr:uncharacterized protein LOC125061088 isoform X39 [Pieris napi]